MLTPGTILPVCSSFYVLHGDFETLRKLTAQVGRQTAAAAAAVTQLLRIPEK